MPGTLTASATRMTTAISSASERGRGAFTVAGASDSSPTSRPYRMRPLGPRCACYGPARVPVSRALDGWYGGAGVDLRKAARAPRAVSRRCDSAADRGYAPTPAGDPRGDWVGGPPGGGPLRLRRTRRVGAARRGDRGEGAYEESDRGRRAGRADRGGRDARAVVRGASAVRSRRRADHA